MSNHEKGLSRASSRRSSVGLSRNTSLARKTSESAAAADLRPSDVLIERFVAWKALVKQLIAYFEGIAAIHNTHAKELTKLGAVIQVPFRAGNQFLGEGGMQDMYYDIRDRTRTIAEEHANLGRTIDTSIVQHLEKVRAEIKAHLKNIQNDTGKLATNVAKERELSARLISELATGITAFKSTPLSVTSKTDPYVINNAVVRQLTKQIHEENLLQKSIISMQQNSAHFEETIVRSMQSAWQTYDEWQARMSGAIASAHSALAQHMAGLAPNREWVAFTQRGEYLLDPTTPLRDPAPAALAYPRKDDPSVVPLRAGLLERKKRYTRTYAEHYFVLTPAGFLHEYASSDASKDREPLFSLFLPMCTLGAPSGVDAKSHKFHIEGRKDAGGGGGLGRSLRASLRRGSGEHAWSFRARSREEMMGWWEEIRELSARHLVMSGEKGAERAGPVAAAVRGAGYLTEEDEGSDGGPGSSVDEDDGFETIDGDPPSYSMMGTRGYTPEKKHTHQRSASASSARVASGETNTNISRSPSTSKRQQEKAPEGREPHVKFDSEPREGKEEAEAAGDDEGSTMPGGDSRFKEHC
ncbi:PH domain-containing protein [Mycena kentingensis (nom. inval.)]|nr:PH domain-containing protein [Mycena kentingensis (nom. inval.)]